MSPFFRVFILSALPLVACSAEDNPNASTGDSATETETTAIGTDSQTGAETASSTSSSTTADTADSESDTAGETDDSAGETTAGGGTVTCDADTVYQCGDGLDNDGDGLVDLADPECVGPCDDDEGSFATGIPGDNIDCFQDCFFDGNSGHGDDECWQNIKCDPANPGEGGLCEYTGTGMCNMESPYDNTNCVEFCAGLTPNGCDCYGCCTVTVDGQEVDIWLGSGDDCSISNIDACNTCTKNDECGNECDPTDCELCFGETELPEGCDDPGGCPDGVQACTTNPDGTSDCPEGLFCLTGCCAEYTPPG